MTKLCYDGTHWSTEISLFRYSRKANGPLATWHGQTFGGTSAYALLGPDIAGPGGISHNPAQATGPGWDQAWGNAATGGPALSFNQDGNIDWKRGHLLNGEWGGDGGIWENLVALSAQANANHATVEGRIRTLLNSFRAFDSANGGHAPYWYCIGYWVQASTAPWSAANTADDLYAYCPNMIKVTWRVMRLTKPVGGPGTSAATFLNTVMAHIRNPPIGAFRQATAVELGHDGIQQPPGLPAVLTNNAANLAEAGGGVHAAPASAPAMGVGTAYDGSVEVFQD
ncbi:MAG: hypothetical protein AAFN94_13745 [Pseudomonadota bacterium]